MVFPAAEIALSSLSSEKKCAYREGGSERGEPSERVLCVPRLILPTRCNHARYLSFVFRTGHVPDLVSVVARVSGASVR